MSDLKKLEEFLTLEKVQFESKQVGDWSVYTYCYHMIQFEDDAISLLIDQVMVVPCRDASWSNPSPMLAVFEVNSWTENGQEHFEYDNPFFVEDFIELVGKIAQINAEAKAIRFLRN